MSDKMGPALGSYSLGSKKDLTYSHAKAHA